MLRYGDSRRGRRSYNFKLPVSGSTLREADQYRFCVHDASHDLWATQAGRTSFLAPPAAIPADAARWQLVDGDGKRADNPRGKPAIVAIEVLTCAASARRGYAENLRCLHRCGQIEGFPRGGQISSEVGDTRLLSRTAHHADDLAIGHIRLGTGA